MSAEVTAWQPTSSIRPLMAVRPLREWDRIDGILAAVAFLLSLALYTLTLAPTITTASTDSAELITNSARLSVAHPPGSPAYVWLGHLASLVPLSEVAARLNFLSALMGAGTVALTYLLVARHQPGGRAGGLAGAAFLATSATFWSQSVIAELYVPSIFMLALTVLGLLEWAARRPLQPGQAAGPGRVWLAVAAVALAISLGTHLANTLYAPAFALFVVLGFPRFRQNGARPRIDFAGGAIAVLVGAVVLVAPFAWQYAALPDTSQPAVPVVQGSDWDRFYAFTFAAWNTWRFFYGWEQLPGRMGIFLGLLWDNFGPLTLTLALVGTWQVARRQARVALLFAAMVAANLVFFLTYRAPDIQVFYIPVFWITACLAGAGTGWLPSAIGNRVKGPRRSAIVGATAVLLTATGLLLIVPQSFSYNDRSHDLHLRDFYGNLFAELPQGTQYYQRGGVSFPLLYYEKLHGVRPDVQVYGGVQPGEPVNPPWPEGPVFSGSTGKDIDIPLFLADPTHSSPKWFQPFLFGMYRWRTQVITETGWLKTFNVLREPPPDWLVPADSPQARPQHPLNMPVTDTLTLLGYDAEPTALMGRPWWLVRYWRATSPDLPHIATALKDKQGQYTAVEYHPPLNGQLEAYLQARGIPPSALPNYVIREETRLVLPSYIEPGQYQVTISPISSRLASQLYDPAAPAELLPNEHPLTTLDLQPAPPPDPIMTTTTPH